MFLLVRGGIGGSHLHWLLCGIDSVARPEQVVCSFCTTAAVRSAQLCTTTTAVDTVAALLDAKEWLLTVDRGGVKGLHTGLRCTADMGQRLDYSPIVTLLHCLITLHS
ncbi:hypothetical protein HanRHA438_Chr03g0133871 [Helianthus annuus]|nr:hypothetical protein HanRHA438_Chr03g0133871 [Helianthus annuus]